MAHAAMLVAITATPKILRMVITPVPLRISIKYRLKVGGVDWLATRASEIPATIKLTHYRAVRMKCAPRNVSQGWSFLVATVSQGASQFEICSIVFFFGL